MGFFEKENKAVSPKEEKTQSVGQSRPSFRKVAEGVKEQIELECFSESDKSIALDIAYLIAESYLLRSDGTVRIGGEIIDVSLMQDIFRELAHEHVELVINNYRGVKYAVSNKKGYLRASLYNSFFELEAHYTNEVACETKQSKK